MDDTIDDLLGQRNDYNAQLAHAEEIEDPNAADSLRRQIEHVDDTIYRLDLRKKIEADKDKANYAMQKFTHHGNRERAELEHDFYTARAIYNQMLLRDEVAASEFVVWYVPVIGRTLATMVFLNEEPDFSGTNYLQYVDEEDINLN